MLWHRAASEADFAREAARWGQQVATRAVVAGGELVLRAGACVCAAFDASELDDAVELAIDLLAEAREEAEELDVAIALALGPIARSGEALEGAVLDRAQLLSNRAAAGELVLDAGAYGELEERLLFARSLKAGRVRGEAVDLAQPYRRDCRSAIYGLPAPALPAGAVFDRRQALAVLQASEPRLLLRTSDRVAALDCIERLRAELSPPLLLPCAPRDGGLQPFSALQVALRRVDLGGALAVPEACEPLLSLRRGGGHDHHTVGEALSGLVEGFPGAWIVLEAVDGVDAASLLAITEVIMDADENGCALLLVLDEGAPIPPQLAMLGDYAELPLEPLSEAQKQRVVAGLLDRDETDDLVRRVAQLAAPGLQDLLVAVRTMLCAGDLIAGPEGVRFRTAPRYATRPIPTEALLRECLAGLPPPARRTLETLCVAPLGSGPSVVQRMAELGAVDAGELRQGLEGLRREGWLDADGRLGALEMPIRNVVQDTMAPARAAELEGVVASHLTAELQSLGPHAFGAAERAVYLRAAGRGGEAANAILDAAEAARHHGFERSAVRLAALAMKRDDSELVKERARDVVAGLDPTATLGGDSEPPMLSERPPPVSLPPSAPPVAHAVGSAIAALSVGDAQAAEDALDGAVVAGWGRSAAQRLTAIAKLAGGDLAAARRALERAYDGNGGGRPDPRHGLTAALVQLQAGDALEAIRLALDALSQARHGRQAAGEAAALHVLSACYRSLGRTREAERIAAAASGA